MEVLLDFHQLLERYGIRFAKESVCYCLALLIEVLLAHFNFTRIHSSLCMRLASLRRPMANLSDSLNELDLGYRHHVFLALPLEYFADATVRRLIKCQEEDKLREANLAVPVRIHHLEDARGVIFQILSDVFLANEFSKVVRRNAVQKVCVRHHRLAFVLLSGKHLEHFFGRSEETDLVLVFAADQV